MSFHVYLLRCSDNTFYCGYAKNLSHRLSQHNSPKSTTKYTRVRQPVEIVYSEVFETKSEAMRREVNIKKLTRIQKEELIKS